MLMAGGVSRHTLGIDNLEDTGLWPMYLTLRASYHFLVLRRSRL